MLSANPGKLIHTYVKDYVLFDLETTGISTAKDEVVEISAIKVLDGKALEDFLAFAGDHILVGHNIHTFDMKFICRDAQRFFGKTIGNDYVDTLQIAQAYLPGLHGLSCLQVYEE